MVFQLNYVLLLWGIDLLLVLSMKDLDKLLIEVKFVSNLTTKN